LKRTIVTAAVLALGVAGTGLASANPPGPNGKNDYGLCKAYFAGSENGREHKRNAPPFQALEEAAGVEEDATAEERDQAVAEFCASAFPGGKEEHPGGGKGGGN
jgi:hypothetical protein